MIKKAVLLTTVAPFLMVFSHYSFSNNDQDYDVYYTAGASGPQPTASAACAAVGASGPASTGIGPWCTGTNDMGNVVYTAAVRSGSFYGEIVPDEFCKAKYSGTRTVSQAGFDRLISGESSNVVGGGCKVSDAGGVAVCTAYGCVIEVTAESSGNIVANPTWSDTGKSDLTSQPLEDSDYSELENNDYLSELPGGCTDSSNCLSVGDKSYLVDWDSAPDYFSYVDANGTTHSKPSSGGGGSGGDSGDTGGGDNGGGDSTDPTNPTDPTDPGGDTGGGDTGGGDDSGNDDSDDSNGGGGSGGGSTVPDFEFDDSEIIAAIESAGRSNRNAINALSNDMFGAIADQTGDITALLDAQSSDLKISNDAQTADLNASIAAQTADFNASLDSSLGGINEAIGAQTDALTGALETLGTSFSDAFGGDGDSFLDSLGSMFDGLVDGLANRFTEDLGTGDDLFNSSGLDDTLDGVAAQEQAHSDEINTLMDEIGDGATSGIADQITSRLPSLPSGSCVPLQFGPMEISCQAFNTIKLWLTWIIYFWTVVSIVDTFFRSEQRTA